MALRIMALISSSLTAGAEVGSADGSAVGSAVGLGFGVGLYLAVGAILGHGLVGTTWAAAWLLVGSWLALGWAVVLQELSKNSVQMSQTRDRMRFPFDEGR